MLTQEEIQNVKEKNLCHDVPLKWTRIDIGKVEWVDGQKVNSVEKKLIAVCSVCGVEFLKNHVQIDLSENNV